MYIQEFFLAAMGLSEQERASRRVGKQHTGKRASLEARTSEESDLKVRKSVGSRLRQTHRPLKDGPYSTRSRFCRELAQKMFDMMGL